MMTSQPGTHVPLVRTQQLQKTYGGIHALRDLSLDINAGQVHALLGENGAGKSTFIKILAGAVRPDSGHIEINGSPVAIHSPHEATANGLAFIHQDPSLIGTMSVAENMFMGTQLYAKGGFTGRRRLRKHFHKIAARVGLDAHPDDLAEQLSSAKQTLVAIGRALAQEASVIVMDEPTATFSDSEAQSLFKIIADLTTQDVAILYVSHRLDEVMRIADVITVLKNGQHMVTLPTEEVRNRDHLVELIVGRPATEVSTVHGHGSTFHDADAGDPVLVAENVSDGRKVRNVSLTVKAGEIVGLTGLVGSGRTEFAKVVFGAAALKAGKIQVAGSRKPIRSPYQAVRSGVALVPEDRRGEGAFMDMTLRENTTLPILKQFQIQERIPILRASAERTFVDRALAALSVKFNSAEQSIKELSGGNQQKVVMAKWTAAKARLIIVDEPTQGVDVGAKAEIYEVIRGLAAAGAAVLLISSEIEEAVLHSDRVVVMREGRTVANLRAPTQQEVLRHCYGSSSQERPAEPASHNSRVH